MVGFGEREEGVKRGRLGASDAGLKGARRALAAPNDTGSVWRVERVYQGSLVYDLDKTLVQ